jgi:hypothetical protein
MEGELSSLIDSLRTGSNRLNADLQLLEGNFDEVRGAVGTRIRFETEPELPEHGYESAHDLVSEPAADAGSTAELDGDIEGARLIALNMALNGTPREETDRYLADNFALSDRPRLLDEVYASVAD